MYVYAISTGNGKGLSQMTILDSYYTSTKQCSSPRLFLPYVFTNTWIGHGYPIVKSYTADPHPYTLSPQNLSFLTTPIAVNLWIKGPRPRPRFLPLFHSHHTQKYPSPGRLTCFVYHTYIPPLLSRTVAVSCHLTSLQTIHRSTRTLDWITLIGEGWAGTVPVFSFHGVLLWMINSVVTL